jgi:hypothetical protein
MGTPPPGMKMGQLAIKLEWKKEWMDRRGQGKEVHQGLGRD